jgi:hypothetical protein
MLHEAWQTWARDWGVAAVVQHPGILLVPDSSVLPVADAARIVHESIAAATNIDHRLLIWTPTKGWRRITLP